MKLSADLQAFEHRIGHRFNKPELLIRALTHGSASSSARPDNQRLEFLGDRVLGLVMAEALLEQDTQASEGQLAPRFNALVRKEACAEVAPQAMCVASTPQAAFVFLHHQKHFFAVCRKKK